MRWWQLWLIAGMAVVYFNNAFWRRLKERQKRCGCPECRARHNGL